MGNPWKDLIDKMTLRCKYCSAVFANEELLFSHQGICEDNPDKQVNRARGRVIDALHDALDDPDGITYDEYEAALHRIDDAGEDWRDSMISDEQYVAEMREVLEDLGVL